VVRGQYSSRLLESLVDLAVGAHAKGVAPALEVGVAKGQRHAFSEARIQEVSLSVAIKETLWSKFPPGLQGLHEGCFVWH